MFSIARRSLTQLGAGLILGMTMVGRLLSEWVPEHSLFGATLLVGVSVMLLIGVLACLAPTLRALRIMPTEALRAEG